MATYAKGTSVSVERSMAELEKVLARYGAKKFYRGHDEQRAVVGFEMKDRRVQFELPLPTSKDVQRSTRSRTSTAALIEQATRERWRALVLAVEAKLVGVSSGIESFEEAFLAHIVIPNPEGGSITLGKLALPATAEAYRTGMLKSPFLLGPGGA